MNPRLARAHEAAAAPAPAATNGSPRKTVTRRAFCHGCDWHAESVNAQGIGAKHAKSRQHQVAVEVTIEFLYGPDG